MFSRPEVTLTMELLIRQPKIYPFSKMIFVNLTYYVKSSENSKKVFGSKNRTPLKDQYSFNKTHTYPIEPQIDAVFGFL